MSNLLTLSEFEDLIKGGESRLSPGKPAWYVLIEDDGDELYYAELPILGEDDIDPEVVLNAYDDYYESQLTLNPKVELNYNFHNPHTETMPIGIKYNGDGLWSLPDGATVTGGHDDSWIITLSDGNELHVYSIE